MKKIFIFGVIFLLLAALSTLGFSEREYVPNELIVKLRASPTEVGAASIDSAEKLATIDALASKHKVASIEKLDKHRVSEAKISFKERGLDKIFLLKFSENSNVNDAIKDFSRNSNVEYVERNYIVHAAIMPNDPSFSSLWGMHNTGQTGGTADADIDAPEAWDTQTGSSEVLIAVIDTGVDYTHQDLSANMWTNPNEAINGIDDDGNGFVDDVRGWDFVNSDNDPFDDHGHGTHVAGTIGAVGNNGIGVVGVSWNVKIMPLKFLNSGGSGTTAGAISAIQYATLMGADVMSNSWGGGGFSQALKDAISAANDSGILFVAAAGNANNDNDALPFYPAGYDVPNVVSVAATDHNDAKAGFSNYGAATVHLGAPGVSILSTAPNGSCSFCSPTGYISISGTSMATPHVSGVAGLIKAQFNLTSNGLKARLLGGADAISSMNSITISGGRLNAYKSLENDIVPPSAVADLAVINSTISSVTLGWTATGDDGNVGIASDYDVRYSTLPITELNWEAANKASGEPKPKTAGSAETFKVKGLSYNTTYYFAVKVFDIANPSPLSNLASGATKVPKVIFEDKMENGINGWASNGLWHQETLRSYSPTKSWAYNTGSPNYNYDIGTNQGNLTSPSIDLSNVTSALLEFKYLYQTEDIGTAWDRRWIKIGANALFCGDVAFSNLNQLSGDPMLVWNTFSADISSYAGKQNVQVRFHFDTIDSILNNFEGWYIDNVRILGEMPGTMNMPPVADADGPYSGTVDSLIAFNGTGSFDPDGSIVSYAWDFGDGSSGAGATPAHSYNATGIYNVSLVVNDGAADSLPDSTTANITAAANVTNATNQTRALLVYGEKSINPSYRLVNGIIGNEQLASSISAQAHWIEVASKPNSKEAIMATLDNLSDVNVQIWDGSAWSSALELTASSQVSSKAFDVEYESISGKALVAYTDLSGSSAQDQIPRYNIWNGAWSSQQQANSIGAIPYIIELASNPKKDEVLLVTSDKASDINVQLWNGSSWSSVAELTANASNKGQPFDVEYESISGEGLIVYTNKDSVDKRVHYRTVINGAIGAEQHGPALGNYGTMYNLIPNPSSDEIILMTIDNDKDTRILVWDGNAWSDKGEVSTNTQSAAYMSIAGSYETNSGRALLIYSDNSNTPKYRIWDGTLSSQQSAAIAQQIPRWIRVASSPNSDELLLIYNTLQDSVDAQQWNGSLWTRTSLSTANTNSARNGIGVAYENS